MKGHLPIGCSFIPESLLIRKGWKIDNLFEIEVSTDSMSPRIKAGDIVTINKAETEPQNGKVYLLKTKFGHFIRRLFWQDGRWKGKADNPDGLPIMDFSIIGRVVRISSIII